ncbi:6599_t:CDS:2 [Diversispora eburnea]|uniref:6599_t:CDS:1 n=1 Tax=Diversispora eburnea TaxID=1213867 RepID=A0A9N8WNA6_9GLOM|nr:6599_t:CDS:2 [Diversispora eburnea]
MTTMTTVSRTPYHNNLFEIDNSLKNLLNEFKKVKNQEIKNNLRVSIETGLVLLKNIKEIAKTSYFSTPLNNSIEKYLDIINNIEKDLENLNLNEEISEDLDSNLQEFWNQLNSCAKDLQEEINSNNDNNANQNLNIECINNNEVNTVNNCNFRKKAWNSNITSKIKAFARLITLGNREHEIEINFKDSIDEGKRNVKKIFYKGKFVAVKEFGLYKQKGIEPKEYIEEIKYVKEIGRGCENILPFYGYCLQKQPCSFHSVTLWADYNLQEYLHKQKILDWNTKISIARGIANGLRHVHKQGKFHYNVTSKNILLTSNLVPMLYNFCINKEDPYMLLSVEFSPKSGWTAPERFGNNNINEYHASSDVYSFAIVLWEIAHQKLPFKQGTFPIDLRNKVLDGERPEPRSSNEIPERYQDLIERGWDQKPENRPSIEKIVEELDLLNSYLNAPNREDNITVNKNENRIRIITNIPNTPNILNTPNTPKTPNRSSTFDSYFPALSPEIQNSSYKTFFSNFVSFKKSLPDSAIEYHKKQRYSKSWEIIKKYLNVKKNDAKTNFLVGYYYLKGYNNDNGKGIPDYKESLKYLYQAAIEEYSDAQYWYARVILFHQKGSSIQMKDQAMKFLRDACSQKHSDANYLYEKLLNHIENVGLIDEIQN